MGIKNLLLLNIFLTLLELSHPLPLSTNGRWIVNEQGLRVKLACVNWVAHLEVMVTEGLNHKPIDVLSKKVTRLGFNCVRLTWPVYLATNHTLASLTVQQSFRRFRLFDTIKAIHAHNPSYLDLTLKDAFQAVVKNLAVNKVLVILDNHISKPGWCCGHMADGNGFFGDRYFNPEQWVDSLYKMTALFRDNPYVVGMSLRNELHGQRQNIKDWYRWMRRGAEAVHRANPDLLVIFSGLKFDKDFSFLRRQPLSLSFNRKTVFEIHWYSFSDPRAWRNGNPNDVCARVVRRIMRRSGFLIYHQGGFPMFVSEWGIDIRGINVNDNRYINCFLAWMAEHDLEWALWTMSGSYYMRQGVPDAIETYGFMDSNWTRVRNRDFLQKIALIKSPLRGPGFSNALEYKFIYHPATGLCVQKKPNTVVGLRLGQCSTSNQWTYDTSQKTLTIKDTNLCLKAQGLDRRARLSFHCSGTKAKWESISVSQLHLAVSLSKHKRLCLDTTSKDKLTTATCKCLSKNIDCNPESQWFKIIDVVDRMITNISVPSPPLLI